MISRLGAVLLQAAVIALITLALLEALVALSFQFPHWSPIPISLVQYLHIRFDRNVIQVMPECATYDEAVTYTLRPGRCTFASREFSNEYRINSLGVRDDEDSLKEPQMVVLGDSLAMGWGVDQDQAFASITERLIGRRTLNAGISSFGTVRELRLLERIDRSGLEIVVIQFNENDTGENEQFVEQPTFTVLTKEQYQKTVADQQRLLRYIPGKYTFNLLVQLRSMLMRSRAPQPDPAQASFERQAELFIRVVERSPVDLGPFRLVVLSVNPDFVDAARRVAQASELEWVRRMEFLDFSSATAPEGARYTLDDHPNAVGHQAIAQLLVRHLSVGD